MANIYVRSTDGSDADNGTTWALAKATLAGAAAIDAAGDTLWVSQSHAESSASAQTITLAGTLASPVRVLCGNDGAEPPTALATTGSITTTGANGITITSGSSGGGYLYGLTFNCGSGATGATLALNGAASSKMIYEQCVFSLVTTAGGSEIAFNSNTSAHLELLNCSLKFGATTQNNSARGMVVIRGGGIVSGSAAVTPIFSQVGGLRLDMDGFDFSNLGSAVNLTDGGASSGGWSAIFRNCKMPASWSGSPVASQITSANGRAEMWNCDSGDTNYRLWIEDYSGSIKSETTLVKTGGASDGDTPLSWKMTTSSAAAYPLHPLRSPEIFSERIGTVGSPKTITVDILHDSVTALKDDEIWLEVQYLGISGVPLGSFADDAKTDVLATAADQASSSAAWTTTGMSNPNKQKLEVTFTPQEEGIAIVTVCMAKASYTVYVDPFAQLGTAGTSLSFQLPGHAQTNVVVSVGGAGGGMRVIGS